MRKMRLVALALVVLLAVAGCSPGKTGSTAGSNTGDGSAGGPGEGSSQGPGASMVAKAELADPFDGSVTVPKTISAAVVAESNYAGEWGPTTRANPTATESGGELVIDQVTDFKGYDPKVLDAGQGTFEMLFTPADDIVDTFVFSKRPEWRKFSTYDPPGNGMLLDTIGWRAAPTGSYGIVAGFTEETASVGWGIWDGSAWHYCNWSKSPWEKRPYRITASYGPAGVRLYVDGELAQEDKTYAGGIDTKQVFTLGQAPWYWPYGPHSLLGRIGEFKYSKTQY